MFVVIRRLLLLMLFVVSVSVGLHAQDNSAMTGSVTDATGAVVPGTEVTLTNASRGIVLKVKTNGEGAYLFPNAPPAPGYTVEFTHEGFTPLKVEGFALLVGNTRTQNAKLAAGGAAEVVQVAIDNAVTLNTTDASIGNNIDIQLVNDLPVQGRSNPTALFNLQPGVTYTPGGSLSVTGARTDQSSVTVDGMDVNDISTGSLSTIVGQMPVDATQEFRGTVAGMTSSQGTASGGQFQLVTKSGTNSFHGDLNEYHRDTSTASNLWFNNNSNVGRTPLIRNQFGGAIGGPVLKDKLYFFADFYNSRIIQSSTATRTVPLDSYRAGNISYVNNTTGCSPLTSRQNTTPNCISAYTPAQVKALDPAAIGESVPLFALITTRYPHANDLTLGDGVNTGGNRFTQPTPNFEYDGVARVDYNLTHSQRVFAQYHIQHTDGIQSVNRFSGDPVTRPNQNRSYGYVVSHIWQIGSNKVNQAYFGDNVQVVSFPLAFNPSGATYISGFGSFTAPYDDGNVQRRRIPIPVVRDDFNWQLGHHSITAGGSFKFIKTSNLLINDLNFYTLGLGGVTTALNTSLRPANISTSSTNTSQWDNAFTLALGRVGSIQSNYNYTAAGAPLASLTGNVRRYRYYQTEVYAGDSWKVNKQLTVSYGLRYQLYSVPFDANGAEAIPSIGFDAYFNQRIAQSKASASGITSLPFVSYNLGGSPNNAPGFFQPNNLNFAPRFSFSYNPSYSSKTVINGSADVVYDRTIYNAINFIQNQSSFLFQNSITVNYGQTSANAALAADPRVGGTGNPVSVAAFGTGFSLPAPAVAPALAKPYTPYVNSSGVPIGLSGGNSNIAVDPNLKTPYSIAYNVGLQQELPGHLILKASYVGRLGRRLLAQADASQLIDFTDPTSGQTLSQAFGAVTTQLRAGVSGLAVTPQPWFENQITRSIGGYPNRTAVLAYNQTTNVKYGDITDPIRFLAQNNLLNANVGVASQFAENDYYTSKGRSAYNGLLLTLSKNLGQGVKFDVNYTFSHSIDNVSVVANTVASGTGFICDVLHMRACRGNSDFDITNVVNGDLVAQLPFGKGHRFASNVPWYVNEAIGDWSISALPAWQSGVAYTTSTSAYIAGFANNAPAIYDNSRSSDTNSHRVKNAANQLQGFANPTAALTHFRGPIGIEYGSRNNLRAPSQFYLDMGLSKYFQLLPANRLKLVFRADAFNVLNHPTFSAPTASITSSSFGIITGQTLSFGSSNSSATRVAQFALRLEF